MKRAFITGSEGFVGGHLWKELADNGYEVFGTSLLEPDHKDLHIFTCDITNPKQISEIVEKLKPDCIFHLAAQPSPHRSWDIPQKTFEINTIGTINLIEAVLKIPDYKPRILFIGSAAEYGDVPENNLPITENTFLDPRSPYAISKLACFYLMKSYVMAKKMDILYSASFSHTGPGQATGFLSSDIAEQIVKIERGEHEPKLMTGYLDNLRDYTDVRDVVRAYRLLIEKGKTGERYNVCTGKKISTGEIYGKLISFSNVHIEHAIDPTRNNPSDVPVIYGSHEKITRNTGWEPKITLDKTLEDLLNWYRTK